MSFVSVNQHQQVVTPLQAGGNNSRFIRQHLCHKLYVRLNYYFYVKLKGKKNSVAI